MTVAEFTPDRKYVQFHMQGMKKYSWLEIGTATWMGDCRGSENRNESLALSPDRQRFATLSPKNGYSELSIGATSRAMGTKRSILRISSVCVLRR